MRHVVFLLSAQRHQESSVSFLKTPWKRLAASLFIISFKWQTSLYISITFRCIYFSLYKVQYQYLTDQKNLLLPLPGVYMWLCPALFFISMVYFFLSLSICLEKSFFQPQNILRICLHIEKGPLAALCSKPLLFMSMEANVAVWRLLMSSLAKNI